MPIYDYSCTSCGHVQEVSHKIVEKPAVLCEKCQSPSKKLISAAGFSLKGSGWYKAGYSGRK
jgi:putative FmdB family regulatory protein